MKKFTHLWLLMLLGVLSVQAEEEVLYETVFEESLTTTASFNKFTTVNSNGNTATYQWKSNTSGARIQRTSSRSLDDWLISPAITMKAGRKYRFSAEANSMYADRGEKVAAAIGSGSEVSAYKTLGEEEVYNTKSNTLVREFTVEADGDYSIAIHDFSEAGVSNTFYIKNFKIEVEKSKGVPAAVTGLQVIPDAAGELAAEIKFTAPDKTMGGETLAAITKIEIYRATSSSATATQTLVATIENPTPGSAQSANVEVSTSTAYHFTVIAYNDEGSGEKASASAFIGEDVLKTPANVALSEEGDHLQLAWDAVTEGELGLYVNPANITYSIVDAATSKPVASGLTTTTYTIEQHPNEGTLTEHQYAVTANNKSGASTRGISNKIVTNEPKPLPFSESFAGHGDDAWDTANWWQATKSSGYSYWQTVTDNYDGDGKGLEYIPWYSNEVMEMNTLKLSLKGTVNPTLVFAHYGEAGSKHKLVVYADKKPQGVNENVYEYDYQTVEGTENAWTQAVVDLKKYVEEDYVIVKFTVESGRSGDAIVIDDINIYDAPAIDLNVALTAPAKVKVGEEKTLDVKVRNNGAENVADYTVEFLVNGELKERKTAQAIAAYGMADFEFSLKPEVTDPETLEVEVRIVTTGDADETNNTAKASIAVGQSTLPKATGLQGETAPGKVTLSWTAPTGGSYTTTEDFEGFTPFSIEASDLAPWTVYDGDGQKTFYVDSYYVPGASYANTETAKAFMVFNPTQAHIDVTTYTYAAAHSGEQYMIAFNPQTYSTNADDWLISPEQTGQAQTISFYAKAMSLWYGTEDLEVYYSTTGNAVADFANKIGETFKLENTEEWKQISIELPEGAKYFAIRCVSSYQMALMIDDITYQAEAPVPTGYNIYRDGKKIATVEAPATSYTDETATEGTSYVYLVTAVYSQGESAVSNDYTASVPTAIYKVAATQTDGQAYTLDGRRANTLRKGIYIINGKKVVVK